MQRAGLSMGIGMGLALACVLAVGVASANVDGGVRVTGLSGTVTAGDTALAQRDRIAANQAIETADDGNLSVLLDEDALAELCSRTRMRYARRDGVRVLHVEAGEARIILDPAHKGAPLEIHTPVAVAMLMGTVVYVEVNPLTGETTFVSADHEIRVESADDSVSGSQTIHGGEATTISRGGAPQPVVERRLDSVGDCLVDLRELSVLADRGAAEKKVQEQVASSDMNDADLPGVEAAGNLPFGLPENQPPDGETDVIDPIDGEDVEIPEQESDLGFDFGF